MNFVGIIQSLLEMSNYKLLLLSSHFLFRAKNLFYYAEVTVTNSATN